MRMKYQLFDSQNETSRELVCVCRLSLTVGMVLFFCQLFLWCSKYQMIALQPKQERGSKTLMALMDCWRKLINKWASEMMARTWLTWKGHLKGLPKFSNEGCCWFRWFRWFRFHVLFHIGCGCSTLFRFFTFTHHRICQLWLHQWHPHDDPSLTHISLRRVVQPPVNSVGFWYPIDMHYIQVFGKLYLIPPWKSWFILMYYSKTRPQYHQVRRKALGPNISLVGLHSSNSTIAWKITTCQRQS